MIPSIDMPDFHFSPSRLLPTNLHCTLYATRIVCEKEPSVLFSLAGINIREHSPKLNTLSGAIATPRAQ